MLVIETTAELQSVLQTWSAQGQKVHFVPTMGALHQGHISLVTQAVSDNCKVITSVFVNPTQFNNPDDLKAYPRTFDQDRDILSKSGCDLMFFPKVEEIYNADPSAEYDLGGLDKGMEGQFRPGHFNGVVQVVDILFSLVRPDKAFFGEKDFQQLAIIRYMMKKLGHSTVVIGCGTVREESGLAMSSRNVRLTLQGKNNAIAIFKALSRMKEEYRKGVQCADIQIIGKSILEEQGDITLEYVEIVDPENLKPLLNNDGSPAVACIAAYVEGVRLIDNMRLNM